MNEIYLRMSDGRLIFTKGEKGELREGENLSTNLVIELSEEFLGYSYNLSFRQSGMNPFMTAPLTAVNGVITFPVPNPLTAIPGSLGLEVIASDLFTGYLAKSATCYLKVTESISGVFSVLPDPYAPWLIKINEAVAITEANALSASESAAFASAQVDRINQSEQASLDMVTACTDQAALALSSAQAAASSHANVVELSSLAAGYANTAGEQAAIAEGHATTAGEQAGIATTQAGIAEGHATTASQQAGIASGHATTASTKAGEASGYATTAGTKATEASGYAATASTKAEEAAGYAASTYTKTEVDGKDALKADKSTTYTKTEVDAKDAGIVAQLNDIEQDFNAQLADIEIEKTPKDLQSQILWRNKSTLLHDFQADITANYGTVEYDTTVKFSGNRSLKLTTHITNKYAVARVDLGVGGIDLSNSHLMLMCRSSGDIASIGLQLWGNAFENLGSFNRAAGGALNRSRNKWQLNTFSGGANNTLTQNVRYIDITPSVAGDIPATIYFNQLRKVDKPTNGYVTITLDGAYIEQYTLLKPLLDAKDYKACFMVTNQPGIDANYHVYMTKTQLKDCENLGWDISIHSGNYVNTVDTMTETELRELAISRKKWLKNNGFNVNRGGRFLCALQNQWNELAVDTLSEYFHFLRTGYGITLQTAIQNTTLPIFNPYCIPDIASNATYEQQVALLEAAAKHKQWAVFTWHKPNSLGELTLQQMSDMLDLIESLGMQVVTFSDVADDILRLK